MKRKDDDAGGRLISSAIVLLILTSLAPLIGSAGPVHQEFLNDSHIFNSASSNESYDLFIDSSTSESGGDGSISAEPDGSSEELSVLSTVEFYTNEMISDIRFYGEGANNYIELSIYLKFTGNDGATTDVTFRLLSGSIYRGASGLGIGRPVLKAAALAALVAVHALMR